MSKFTDRRKFRKNNPSRPALLPAQMGDGYGNLAVPNQPGYYYCRVAGRIEIVYNDRVPAQNDLLVDVGRDTVLGSETPGIFKVISTRSSAPAGQGSQVQVGYAPAKRYEIFAAGGGQDPLWVQQRQFMPLRTGPYSGMTVEVYPGIVTTSTGRKVMAFSTLDLTTHVPAGAGDAAFVLITIDDDGDIIQTKGAEFVLEDMTTPELMLANIPAAPPGSVYESAAVRVYNGQTAVQETRTNTDIIDLRWGGFSVGIGVESVTGDGVDNTDPANPVMSFPTPAEIGALTSANIENAITDGENSKAPSENAVFDALALKQPLDSDLTTIAGLTATTDSFIQSKSSTWAARTIAQVAADLGTLLQLVSGKDATGGYAGLTLFKINFKNAANTFTNFFTNATTAARTYTFPDKDITVAGTVDITGTNSGTNTGDETAARIATINHGTSAKTTLVDADEITGQDSAASFGLIRTTWTNVKSFLKTYFDTLYTAIGGREVLTASRTYYVRTDGSDSNNGLSNTAGGAFLTIQKAINTLATLDLSIYNVTIQIGAGTFSTAVGNELKQCVGSGTVTIIGDETTPSNVVVKLTAAIGSTGACFFNFSATTNYLITGFQFKTDATTNYALLVIGTYLQMQKCDFNAGSQNFAAHMRTENPGASIDIIGSYTISAGAGSHTNTINGSLIRTGVNVTPTITLTGTPAFTSAFALLVVGSEQRWNTATFSGAATGKRYQIDYNSVLLTATNSETALPGDALGSKSSGGQYNIFVGNARTAAQFDKANTTLADITGLSVAVLAGRTYRFRSILYTTSNIASGVKAAIAGTCTATSIIYEAMVLQAGVLVAPGTSRATALGTTVANVTAVTAATIIIEGAITVNAAGTLTVQFADNAGTNTSSVLVAFLEVVDITP